MLNISDDFKHFCFINVNTSKGQGFLGGAVVNCLAVQGSRVQSLEGEIRPQCLIARILLQSPRIFF